ncbi:MAG: hypothetical protein JXP34_27880 [Planctomycetes bacterium]|nr:hypothetical protein [Planctomycetota bacterium]
MRLLLMGAAIGLAVGGGAVAAEKAAPPEVGLKVGEGVPPFTVLDVTGPNKGKSLCYR